MAKSKARGIGVWIILGLLFVGLMGFGATGLSGNVRTIGTVGEKPLEAQRYYQELQSQIRIRSAQVGRAVSFPEADEAGLPLRALQSVVQERVMDNETAQLGLSVGDDVVSEQVLATPAFRGIDGTFDAGAYRDALDRAGYTVKDYETGLREDAARALVQGAVFTGIPDPQSFGETVAQYTREGRTFTWAPLRAEDVDLTLDEPTEEDLQAHHDANPDLYTSLETRIIRYVWLTPAMIQDDMPVDEAELREEYDDRIEEFQQPERRLVEQLAFSDEAAATEALAAIQAGETSFPELVADRGLTLSDVDIGDVTQAQMNEAGPAIFGAQTGDVVGPFPTDLGPALFRMNAVLAAKNITFEEALPDLREDQAANRARRFIDDQVDEIENLLAGGAGLEDVAEQTDMELGSVDWTVEVSDDIAAYAAFRDLAVAQEVGAFPELATLDDGGLFAIEVLDVQEPRVRPLDEVREMVTLGWQAEQRQAAVLAEAEAKQGQLNEAVQDFAALDLDAVQEIAMTRRGFINGAPTDFLQQVFQMEVSEVRVLPNDGGAIIVRLDEVVPADPADETFAAEAEAIAQSASEAIAQDIYELYSRDVQLRTDIQLNDAAINAIHTNFR